ncbi:MAG: multidrug effflux MFS transporter [Azoarcus sp.]|nr:multidrug effflux MFS transporter [Azoarcus sp.]
MPSTSPWLAVVLAALAAIGPFAIDTYLPAFPEMASALGATQVEIQQTLTAYMATFAFMVLWHGALADRFGRRRVLIGATVLFSVASFLCAFATTIEWLWAGRALQGLCGGAGMVVGRAVIRDLHDGAQAQRLMSRVMMIFGIAPAVAPLVGGVLLALAGWRSIFIFLAVFGLLLTYLTWRLLPETLAPEARQPLHPVALGRAYRAVLSSRAFLLLAGAVALMFNGFFLYILSAPVFVMTHLGLGPQDFAWLFVPSVAGMMLGSALSGRVAGRWTQMRTIGGGFVVMFAAAVAGVVLAFIGPAQALWLVLPIAVYNLGMALAMPSLGILALDLFPQRRGMASSCQSFLQVGINALTAGLLAPLLWGSPLTLALGMLVFAGLSLAAFMTWRRRETSA